MMMSRSSIRPMAALVLAIGLVAYVGCNSGTDGTGGDLPAASPSPGGVKPGSAGAETGTSKKLFADWPKPVAALLISGEQDGYLEPCGCTSGQLGGLRRRYDLIRHIRETDQWPLALVDLGSLVKDPAGARGGPEQVKIKFSVALKALEMLKYDAFALSAEDLKVGVGESLGQIINLAEKPRVVVANVKPAEGFDQNIRPSVKTKVGPMTIGITAILDPDALNKLKDDEKDALLPTILSPEAALPGVLADLENDTDTQVLLVQGPPELAKSLAAKFPGFDIVVATSDSDPDADPERLNGGKTILVKVGTKGKYVGVVGLYNDPKQKYRFQRVPLNSRYNGDAGPMRKLIEDDFQEMLKQAGVVENFPRRNFVGGAPGATFVGAETCKTCHPGTYAKWAATKHAHAFEDIVTDPKGDRSDHQFDAECISCHTTGFEYNSGWKSAAATPYLKGNQCENCHGPASKHVEEPDNQEFRKLIARTAAGADKAGLCYRCHDEDNSPKFNFQTYWGQIAHSKLDQYTDPKVHEGIKPATAGASEPAK
ncbi:multiheme c-type cytochrome [Singulisphaera acidiphila]|nr:multiheme c-type cytochrome [Singulisphaera acidiphila]